MGNNLLEYKGYFAKIQYSASDNLLYGKIEGIADLVTFETQNCNEVKNEFEKAVDGYLDFCNEVGKPPERPYKGSFNVRISPELHKAADVSAKKTGISLNQFIVKAIEYYLSDSIDKTIIYYYPVPEKMWNTNFNVANYQDEGRQKINAKEINVEWQR